MAIRHKCFISYHHEDQDEVDHFVDTFDHTHNIFIARGLGQSMAQDIIDSSNTDYVMQRIRSLYLADSTVTIVMLGNCTWARRYVDWEIQASLRQGQTIVPNGLLAIKLPSYEAGPHKNFPSRLNSNLLSDEDKAAGRDCYARHMPYPTDLESLTGAIDRAHGRRSTHAKWINNPRERFSNNRTCS